MILLFLKQIRIFTMKLLDLLKQNPLLSRVRWNFISIYASDLIFFPSHLFFFVIWKRKNEHPKTFLSNSFTLSPLLSKFNFWSLMWWLSKSITSRLFCNNIKIFDIFDLIRFFSHPSKRLDVWLLMFLWISWNFISFFLLLLLHKSIEQ